MANQNDDDNRGYTNIFQRSSPEPTDDEELTVLRAELKALRTLGSAHSNHSMDIRTNNETILALMQKLQPAAKFTPDLTENRKTIVTTKATQKLSVSELLQQVK